MFPEWVYPLVYGLYVTCIHDIVFCCFHTGRYRKGQLLLWLFLMVVGIALYYTSFQQVFHALHLIYATDEWIKTNYKQTNNKIWKEIKMVLEVNKDHLKYKNVIRIISHYLWKISSFQRFPKLLLSHLNKH